MGLFASFYVLLRGLVRLKFGEWIDQEVLFETTKAIREIHSPAYANIFYSYVKLVTRLPLFVLRRMEWQSFLILFSACRRYNEIVPIPLTITQSKKQEKPDSWDYSGRSKVIWMNLLCERYGWTVEYVRSLPVDTVFQLAQEILIDKQLEREFLWSMSEIAYPYNSSTKRSEFKALKRPAFMQPKATEPKTFKMPVKFMPMGIVQDSGGMSEYVKQKNSA